MRRSGTVWFGLALVVFAPGCRHGDLVEAELRTREQDVRQLREELERSACYNQALQQELKGLRGEVCPADGPGVAGVPVRTLVLGRQTGGRASDGCMGDDALQVVLEPRDPEGQAVKAPGSVLVQAVEVSTAGLKRPLSTWEVPPEQLRRAWRSGLFTTGYVLTLPWKVWPSTSKVRVVAQFRTPDGKLFEADKDVTVRVTPENQRKVLPPETVEPQPKLPPPTESDVLPPPRRLNPGESGPALEPTRGQATPPAEILRPVALVPGT